jgi:hypothetical protein
MLIYERKKEKNSGVPRGIVEVFRVGELYERISMKRLRNWVELWD